MCILAEGFERRGRVHDRRPGTQIDRHANVSGTSSLDASRRGAALAWNAMQSSQRTALPPAYDRIAEGL